MKGDAYEGEQLTRLIIGCAFDVANGLGDGFLEKVYENALAYKLRQAGLIVEQQYAVDVRFEGHVVGSYVADLVVAGAVILELKAVAALNARHVAQCLNLRKACMLPICLLLNFGASRLEIRRFDRPV
jgi:GxxExxY protein